MPWHRSVAGSAGGRQHCEIFHRWILLKSRINNFIIFKKITCNLNNLFEFVFHLKFTFLFLYERHTPPSMSSKHKQCCYLYYIYYILNNIYEYLFFLMSNNYVFELVKYLTLSTSCFGESLLTHF